MAKSKNINIFLMDGEVTGRIKCTISNWTGVIFKIPKNMIASLKDRDELKQSGIYFLFGEIEQENYKKDLVYIGQAGIRKNGEGVLFRVMEHNRDTDIEYFNDVIVLTTQNNSFGATEISYLENKFTNLAKEIGRCVIKNSNEPNLGNVTEEKESELDEIIENTKMIIGTLGYKIFVPIINEQLEKLNEDKLYLSINKKNGSVINASCKRTNEGFVVLKGSDICLKDVPSMPKTLKKLRENLIRDNVIQDGILTENQLFNSPSYAASFVLGISVNGKSAWKNKDNLSLKEIEELEIKQLE